MSNFALRMKELRKEKKLKQQELADEFSVKLRTYQGYEYGESYPEVAKLLAIADFFDVSLDYLILGKKQSDAVDRVNAAIAELTALKQML